VIFPVPAQVPTVRSEFIYETAPFPACHASTLVQTKDGAILAAWFGGTKEGATDVCIYLSRYTDSGWSVPAKVASGIDKKGLPVPCWNPVLFQPQGGPLMLFYKVGRQIAKWTGWEIESKDDGLTWSAPRQLPRRIIGPVKNKPIQLRDGRIVSGSSEERGGWTVHFEFSDDNGRTWSRTNSTNSAADEGAIQPSLLQGSDGTLIAVGRTNQHRIFYQDSVDGGTSWSEMRLLNVLNPNSGIDATTLKSGMFVLIYNDSDSKRYPLNIATSWDGINWRPVGALETGPGEFSYPAIIQTRDGMIHVTYTWNRRKIKHVVIDPATLESSDAPHRFH
jgi:predicted neuraminidase